jgi:hypothetical protein
VGPLPRARPATYGAIHGAGSGIARLHAMDRPGYRELRLGARAEAEGQVEALDSRSRRSLNPNNCGARHLSRIVIPDTTCVGGSASA